MDWLKVVNAFVSLQAHLRETSTALENAIALGEAGRSLWNDEYPDEAFSVDDFVELEKVLRRLGV